MNHSHTETRVKDKSYKNLKAKIRFQTFTKTVQYTHKTDKYMVQVL